MTKNVQYIGAIGENIAITQLLWHGWAPSNLNAIVSNTPNVDILAIKNDCTISIQVKTSGPTSKNMLQLGYSGSEQVFNTKRGPKADFIVFVRLFDPHHHECYVVPVEEAERVAQLTAQNWMNTLKKDGTKRDPKFDRCIRFELNKNRPDVSGYNEKWRHYLNAWHLLEKE